VELTFYTCALVAIAAALRCVTHTNPVHALLYLVVVLLAAAGIFFALGAPFVGALEVIVYAGAIMVLFVFVVMMLNLGSDTIAQEREWLQLRAWIGPSLLATLMLVALVEGMLGTGGAMGTVTVGAKEVGIALFGPYLLAVELASLMLLGALVAAYHLGRGDTR
jgi:NADH-quinone oxidoreductase subunit J